MTKARDLANLISTGNPLADGAISVAEISDLTASASEINKLDGLNASTAELNQVVGATSALQTQLDNISVTSGSLTKTFTQNETADITLSQGITSAPVVSATKEVPQTGISSKGAWDVNSTASNYDFHNTATAVTLTPSTVSVASDVSGASYDSVYFSVASQQDDPQGCTFGDSGNKLYVAGKIPQAVHQYNLTTAYDISTASYASKVLDTSSQTNQTRNIKFKSDGTVAYVIDDQSYRVLYYNLSTAWDISTASYTGAFSVGAQGRGLAFKPDGTKMYHLQPSNIKEYTLSTAWDLTTASNTHTASGFSGNEIALSSNGTRLYVLSGSTIQDHTLSTAYDLSTVSSVVSNFSVSSQTGDAQGILLNADDTKIFMLEKTNDYLYQYTNGLSTTAALVLGSGSFASTDVGKRITGNGGDVILTATSGAYSTTGGSAFTDSSTIAAGSWSMFGLKSAGDVSGITMSNVTQQGALNIDQITYSSTQKSVASQDSDPRGVRLNNDGTKMFVMGNSNNEVFEYSLSTAYDVSTASYGNISYVLNGPTNCLDVLFNNDGSKMYVCSSHPSPSRIYEYNLTTPFSLATGNVSASNTFSLSGQGGSSSCHGITFNNDGTKLYAAISSSIVYQYTLTTAFDISTASYASKSYNANSQVNDISGINFNVDGTSMYISCNGTDAIYQYSLTTAYDISTASYASKSFSTTSQDPTPEGFCFADNFTKMYLAGEGGDRIFQYATAFSQTFVQPTAQYHVGVTNSGGQIDSQYFTDINSMTAAESAGTGTVNYAVSTDGRTTWSVAKGTSGVRPIVRNNSGTWQYNNDAGTTSSSYYNLSTASYDNKSFVTTNESGSPREVQFNTNGTKMYVLSDSSNKVWQYDLSTAFDVSTASYNSVNFNIANQLTGAQGFTFNNNGTRMYVVGETNDTVYQYDLSTAFNVSTAAYNNVSFSIGGQQAIAGTIVFNGDGTKMFLCGESEDYVRQYTLSTAFNVGTASLASGSLDHSSQSTTVTGMAFNGDGTKLFLASRASEEVIYQYGLTTAYDVSTASYDNVSFNLDQASQFSASLQGIVFNNDGSKVYAMDNGGNVFQYSTGGTVSLYATTATWANGTVNDELYTLQQALGAQSHNRMDKTQLDAVADANHFSTGTSLDLMIALRMDAAASTLPTSDGVTLNYDAAALNEGAVLGTDYDFFHPAANKVQIKSLAAQNLKVRVV